MAYVVDGWPETVVWLLENDPAAYETLVVSAKARVAAITISHKKRLTVMPNMTNTHSHDGTKLDARPPGRRKKSSK